MHTYIGDPMDVVKGNALHGQVLGGIACGQIKPELGMTERASCVARGLQALFDKMGNLRDKIEGNSQASGKPCTPVSGGGLRGHITEAESILSACHSLLDDIAGKF
jgi:hypothetical protein